MRLLLTGSNGFIGGRIAAAAAERGWHVTGLGRAPRAATPVAGYICHDVRHPLNYGGQVDAVVHAAALASPWARPSEFMAVNAAGTRNMLTWCRGHGRPYFALISSSSVLYRHADQFGLTEDSPVPPAARQLNAYSRSKRSAELMVADYGGPSSILRPRAVFGPGDTILLPRILAAAERGLLPVFESGSRPHIRCDLTFVDTVVAYVITAIERQARGVYNLTNGEQVELYPFLTAVLARLGYEPKLRRVPVSVAMALAGVAEAVSATVGGYREPLITRFGVSMLAYSRTFDAAKCQRDLGPPAVSLADGVERLVAAHTRR
jgi:nucleoside-diphosphate-sugar epimerase